MHARPHLRTLAHTHISTHNTHTQAATLIPPVIAKWFPVIENRLPTTGFALGLEYPTAADLAILLIMKGSHVYGAGVRMAGVDVAATYPKMTAIAAAAAVTPTFKAYLDASKSFSADPMGIDK
jgi:hypothetical protein